MTGGTGIDPLTMTSGWGWLASLQMGPDEVGIGQKEAVSLSVLSAGMHMVSTSAQASMMPKCVVTTFRWQLYSGCNRSRYEISIAPDFGKSVRVAVYMIRVIGCQ